MDDVVVVIMVTDAREMNGSINIIDDTLQREQRAEESRTHRQHRHFGGNRSTVPFQKYL